MAENGWLYCNIDWNDIINIVKVEKNCDKRLREFHNILAEEGMTIKDVMTDWALIDKSDIKDQVNEWFNKYDYDAIVGVTDYVYWFFNIYTGEALHIQCSISVSDIIVD